MTPCDQDRHDHIASERLPPDVCAAFELLMSYFALHPELHSCGFTGFRSDPALAGQPFGLLIRVGTWPSLIMQGSVQHDEGF